VAGKKTDGSKKQEAYYRGGFHPAKIPTTMSPNHYLQMTKLLTKKRSKKNRMSILNWISLPEAR
jgi:hypothetical protein